MGVLIMRADVGIGPYENRGQARLVPTGVTRADVGIGPYGGVSNG